jgi:elongation factor P--(R)-beta-lysine ligase
MPKAVLPWWNTAAHERRRPFLEARGAIRRRLETWLFEESFMLVECGALQVSPGNETHLHAFATDFVTDQGARQTRYLHTSPEFASKKLLAAGETKIADFARVYRNRETGPLHAPEFTMLEWYRVGADLDTVMQDAHTFINLAADAVDTDALHWRGQACDITRQAIYLSVAEAFERYCGADLNTLLDDQGAMAALARQHGLNPKADDSWSDLFSALLVTRIEPHLGRERPTFLHRYPLCEAALAKACADDPRYAERFELYACGVELANGFEELTDPVEQRARFEADMELKARLYGERYPIDEDFLSALAVMPAASGVAMGFDRLVMLASGASHINDVIWTPFPS